jgi:hypothetical protein
MIEILLILIIFIADIINTPNPIKKNSVVVYAQRKFLVIIFSLWFPVIIPMI